MGNKSSELFSDDIGGSRERELASSVELPESPYKKRFFDEVKNYVVDTTAGISFYTPIMAVSEYFIGGMDSYEVLKSRLFAGACYCVIMRPLGKFRRWYANLWNADPESSQLKKFLVDASATVITQIPLYSTILYSSGASLDEITKALPAGIAIGAATGRPFCYFWDKYRKFWGTKPVLDK